MENLIQPNLHPLIVHFTIAFLITGPIFLLVSSFAQRKASWHENIRITGDWMLALGLISALAALAAGLQAYYSVNHDAPSHLAMTDHRNWAFGTISVFIVFGGWRFSNRGHVPSKIFAVLLLLPTLLVAVTGWKGGHLVYQYGVGVESLPQVTGDGHDHDHNVSSDHGEAIPTNDMPLNDGDHAEDHGDHAHAENSSALAKSQSPSNALDGHGDDHSQSGPMIRRDGKTKEDKTNEHDHSGHEH